MKMASFQPTDDNTFQKFESVINPTHKQKQSQIHFQVLEMPARPCGGAFDAQKVKEKLNACQQRGDLDHFINENNKIFAGRHLVIDIWGAKHLDCLKLMEQAMREGIEQSGAHLLHIQLHHFTPNFGVSGVAILSESHISVHTWPECAFGAFDVFMCGDAQPRKFIEVIEARFFPEHIYVSEIHRGIVNQCNH